MSFIEKTAQYSGFDQAQLNALAVPSMKNEQWKYTNFERLIQEPWTPANESTKPEQTSIEDIPTLRIFGNRFSEETNLAGIKIRLSSEQEKQQFLKREHHYSEEFLSKLINASPCLFLTIEEINESATAGIEFVGVEKEQVNIVILSQLKNKMSLDLHFKGVGQYHCHLWGELTSNQKLEHTLYQNLDSESSFLFESHFNIDRDAHYGQVLIQNGARFSRHNVSASLVGENAECDLHALYRPTGSSHVDNNSYIQHAAPHSFSRQVYKGIMGDQSKGIFAGIVKVNKDCLLIEAQQLNKNLLLTNKSQAFSRPQMEIDADDVKCAHGSTIGQLSEQELFYFESRGIRKDKARAMLAEGFAMDVILKIQQPKLRELAIKRLRGLC